MDIGVKCIVQTLCSINMQRRKPSLAGLGRISWRVLEVAGKDGQNSGGQDGR